MGEQNPFFTIAIPAYKRDVLLKESVASCLKQSFRDFELLIGNDDPSVVLTPPMFGGDSRIRIINRPFNLGELGNMNALIQEANGRYFVWLSDDDLFMLDFLTAVYKVLADQKDIRCVYTSYIMGETPPEEFKVCEEAIRYLSGREWIKGYLSRENKIQGWYGVFELHLIREIGGMKQLGNSISSFCSDMLIPLQVAQSGRIAFINSPLIFFRLHQGSGSTFSIDHEAYKSTQLAFLQAAGPILSADGLKDDFARNIYWLMKWFTADYFEVMRRSGGKKWWQSFQYWSDMEKFNGQIKGFVWKYRLFMVNRFCWLLKHLLI